MEGNDRLSVVVDAVTELRPIEERPLGGIGEGPGLQVIDLDLPAVAVNLSDELEKVMGLLETAPMLSDHYEVKDVTFSLAVERDGKVSLLSGVAGPLVNKTAFTFKVHRREHPDKPREEIAPPLAP